jgi:hypothetical protein
LGELTPGLFVLAGTFVRFVGSVGEALPVAANAATASAPAPKTAASGRRMDRVMLPPVFGAGPMPARAEGDAMARDPVPR